jgi:hypothetical protein
LFCARPDIFKALWVEEFGHGVDTPLTVSFAKVVIRTDPQRSVFCFLEDGVAHEFDIRRDRASRCLDSPTTTMLYEPEGKREEIPYGGLAHMRMVNTSSMDLAHYKQFCSGGMALKMFMPCHSLGELMSIARFLTSRGFDLSEATVRSRFAEVGPYLRHMLSNQEKWNEIIKERDLVLSRLDLSTLTKMADLERDLYDVAPKVSHLAMKLVVDRGGKFPYTGYHADLASGAVIGKVKELISHLDLAKLKALLRDELIAQSPKARYTFEEVVAKTLKMGVDWDVAEIDFAGRENPSPKWNKFSPRFAELKPIDTSFEPKASQLTLGVLCRPSNDLYPFTDFVWRLDQNRVALLQVCTGPDHSKSFSSFLKMATSLGLDENTEYQLYYVMLESYAEQIASKVQSWSLVFTDGIGTQNSEEGKAAALLDSIQQIMKRMKVYVVKSPFGSFSGMQVTKERSKAAGAPMDYSSFNWNEILAKNDAATRNKTTGKVLEIYLKKRQLAVGRGKERMFTRAFEHFHKI